ncbi:MAG: metallothionein [Mycobacterium sp.]|nr:metallothionein [Mycobacterium sp.]MBV9351422.1 metallothionein [Mycobacterium sp.]
MGVPAMADYEKGTLLTCGHEGCGCRVRIEVECHCAESGQAYRCTCGDELVAVS